MTTLYGLLGRKLAHSFSRGYFTEKFHNERIHAVYENFEIEKIEEIIPLIQQHKNLVGLNVTIPFKEEVIPYLDGLTLTAELVGAVNVIEFKNGKLFGHNTDVIGFRDSLAAAYDHGPGGNALILGTGGAAKAVNFVLHHYFAFDEIRFVSREPKSENEIGYDVLDESLLKETRLVVNTTPLGMFPNIDEMPELPIENLVQSCLVFDLIYNPTETKLLQAAKLNGNPIQNGMDMLIKQADAAWEIWNGE